MNLPFDLKMDRCQYPVYCYYILVVSSVQERRSWRKTTLMDKLYRTSEKSPRVRTKRIKGCHIAELAYFYLFFFIIFLEYMFKQLCRTWVHTLEFFFTVYAQFFNLRTVPLAPGVAFVSGTRKKIAKGRFLESDSHLQNVEISS